VTDNVTTGVRLRAAAADVIVVMVNARIGDLGFDMDESDGRPSRWNTLRAMHVLARYEAGR
jgi:hypothetical protein